MINPGLRFLAIIPMQGGILDDSECGPCVRIFDDVWSVCVCYVVNSPSRNWYGLLISEKKLCMVLRPVLGVVSLPERERVTWGE